MEKQKTVKLTGKSCELNKSKSEYPSDTGCSEAKYGLLYGVCADDTAANVVSSLHYTKKLIAKFCMARIT